MAIIDREVVSPCAFRHDHLDGDAIGAKHYRTLVLSHLHRAESNAIIYLDDGGCLVHALETSLSSWPDTQRASALGLMVRLRNRGRFVPVSARVDENNDAAMCPSCLTAREVVSIASPDYAIAPIGCAGQSLFDGCGCKTLTIDDYAIGVLNTADDEKRSCHVDKMTWSLRDFEDRILDPVLRDAKHVRILDRWFGRHVSGENPPQVRQSFSESIEWILRRWLLHSDGKSDRLFEIVTGTFTKHERVTTRALYDWKHSMGKTHKFPVQVIVKLERHGAELPHDRYLLTNQFMLSPGSGFDFLDTQGNLRSHTWRLDSWGNRAVVERGFYDLLPNAK